MYKLLLDGKEWPCTTLEQVAFICEFYNVDWQEIDLALNELKKNNHRVVDFGGTGTFILTRP